MPSGREPERDADGEAPPRQSGKDSDADRGRSAGADAVSGLASVRHLERPVPKIPPFEAGKVRDLMVLAIGLLTVINILSYKFFETYWSTHFAVYNSVFLSVLTVFIALGLILLVPGIFIVARHSPRKLVLLVAGIILASSSVGVLLYTRQGSLLGLLMGIIALISLLLLVAGQFESSWRSAGGAALLVTGLALITIVPVHEAFLVNPFGSVTAMPNLLIAAAGVLFSLGGMAMVFGKGASRGRATNSFILWLIGVLALFLVPFHEASGINSNGVYGVLDQTLILTGAVTIGAGIVLFIRKRKEDGDFEAHLHAGDRLYARGNCRGAMVCYDRALEINPEYTDAWVHKGSAHERLGNNTKAIECLENALAVNPEDHAALSQIASVYRQMGKAGKALQMASLATELQPEYEIGWLNRANALMDLNRTGEALEAFDRTVELNPDYEKAWYNKGILLFTQGRYDDALPCFDEALGIVPHDETFLRARDACLQAMVASKAGA